MSCDKTSALVVTVTVTVTVRLREDQRREQTNISGQPGQDDHDTCAVFAEGSSTYLGDRKTHKQKKKLKHYVKS